MSAPQLVPGHNCMAVASADKFSVIVDADGYYRLAREAMSKARRRITLIGWDFDARIYLGDAAADGGPSDLGAFILWLVERNPDLEIFLLQWDFGLFTTIKRGTTLFSLWRWMRHQRVHVKFDSSHPPGASHHQKIMVIDDSLAFVGGIDMTGARWDTREHRHEDPRRRRPTTRRRYKPWHDVTTAITGPAVDAVLDVARERWAAAEATPPLDPLGLTIDHWPESLPAQFTDVPLAFARTVSAAEPGGAVLEVERLWLDQIAAASRFIYIESQYFASRVVVSAMAKRLLEPDGPEIVVINPDTAEGWLQPLAMDTARARLFAWLKRADRYDRFRLFHPVGTGGEAIYVHAKVLIADDDTLKVGSSNINNRSMRLDTECDVCVTAAEADDPVSQQIAWVRNDLLAEHLGTVAETVAQTIARTGSLIQTIEALAGEGRTLRPYHPPELGSLEKWLADNEVLDPEGPAEMFEPLSARGLARGFIARFAGRKNKKGRA